MKIRLMIRAATFVWGAYRVYRRSRSNVRSVARGTLRRVQRI